MEHLFISYSRRDEAYVSAVAEALRARGIEVWQDISGKATGIPYSTKWFEVIQEALFASAGAVVFTSDEWRKSGPCRKEIELIEALDIPYKMVEVPRGAGVEKDALLMAAMEAGNLSAETAAGILPSETPVGNLPSDTATAVKQTTEATEAGGLPSDTAERIAAWSAADVFGDTGNMDRVWMLTMIWNQRTKYGALAGIPHFRKRRDAKAFLDRLERCRAISDQRNFPARLARCRRIVTEDAGSGTNASETAMGEASGSGITGSVITGGAASGSAASASNDEVVRFLKKARRETILSLLVRPVAAAAVLMLIAGSVAVNWRYSVQRDQARQHLEALQTMEEIRDLMDADEAQALALMGQESLTFGEYLTLLYGAYAEILSREFPAERYASGTEEAKKIDSLPGQTDAAGYTVELSDTSGIVRVYTDVLPDGARRMLALSVSDRPTGFAAQDGYLAIAAGRNAYVFDLSRGASAVQLHGCGGRIEKIRFDESGQICAVTDTGEACLWENPIRRAICGADEVPGVSSDREQSREQSLEQFTQDRSIRLTASADGMICACDTARDCVIWQCTAVTEPVTDLLLEEASMTVYALGRSGTWYRIDASEILLPYDSKDVEGQRERYREAGRARGLTS